MAPPIRLFLADVDGTLVTQDKILTDRAIAAVAKLRQAGILFAITSGRPPRGMSMLIEPLQLTMPIAGFNGGVFVRPDMSVIEQQVIPDDVTPTVIDLLGTHDLDEVGEPGERWDGADPPTLERVLFHLLQEYARHVGHLDIVAELAGGSTGE